MANLNNPLAVGDFVRYEYPIGVSGEGEIHARSAAVTDIWEFCGAIPTGKKIRVPSGQVERHPTGRLDTPLQ